MSSTHWGRIVLFRLWFLSHNNSIFVRKNPEIRSVTLLQIVLSVLTIKKRESNKTGECVKVSTVQSSGFTSPPVSSKN